MPSRPISCHTFFYREYAHFQFLMHEFFPAFAGFSPAEKIDLRIWSAGCSSGQEAYTLAMCLAKAIQEENIGRDRFVLPVILSTDISRKKLEEARHGIFKKEDILKLPAEMQSEYFQAVEDDPRKYRVSPEIREMVIFKRLNLNGDEFPFKKKFNIIPGVYFKQHWRESYR